MDTHQPASDRASSVVAGSRIHRGPLLRSRLSAFVLCVLAANPGPTDARTIRVPNELTTIQAAIDAASPGDEILVAPGRYSGAGNKNLDLRQKDIGLRSEDGPEVTTIDCEGSGRAFVLYGPSTPSAVIEGFTIVNGDGNREQVGGGGMIIGGGSPTIRRCVFRNNKATSSNFTGGGGGLACHGSSSLIEDCTFIENSVVEAVGAVGGGLASHQSSPTIRGCRFIQNVARGPACDGGGIFVHRFPGKSAVIIEDCELVGNESRGGGGAAVVGTKIVRCTIADNRSERGVGGISLHHSTMEDCSITGNTGQFGGGVAAGYSQVIRCVIMDNTAPQGGGLRLVGSNVVEECLIADNVAEVGGGLACIGGEVTTIRRCTIVRNHAVQGSGIAYPAICTLRTHLIEATIVAHGRGGSAIDCFVPESVMLSCTDLFGNEGGDWIGCAAGQDGMRGNFSVDPGFCNEKDFTLSASSPCLPGNHPQGADCGIIGSEDKGCAALAVESTTWGTIKQRYQK